MGQLIEEQAEEEGRRKCKGSKMFMGVACVCVCLLNHWVFPLLFVGTPLIDHTE